MLSEFPNTLRSVSETIRSILDGMHETSSGRRMIHGTPVSPLDLLKITQRDDEKGRRVLHIKAGWRKIAADYDGIVTEYEKVPVAGFPLGTAPRSVVEQRYQKLILFELSRRAAQRLSREAMRETGLESQEPIEIGDIDCGKGQPLRFTACIGTGRRF